MEAGALIGSIAELLMLINRKCELALAIARAEQKMHTRYGKDHGTFDPDYSVSSPTLREEHASLQAEYDEIREKILDVVERMNDQGYKIHLVG